MRFQPAGQRRRPAVEVSCYGKLPCYRDFLQVGIDSAVGRWMVETLDAAHDAIVAGGQTIPPTRELRVLLRLPGTIDTPFAALVRPSRDAVGRRGSVIVGLHLDAAGLAAEPHLAPLCAAPLWSSLGRHVIENPGRSRDELLLRLRTLPEHADELAVVRERFTRFVGSTLADPWRQLAGETAEPPPAATETAAPTACLSAAAGAALPALAGPAELAAVWLRLWAQTAGRAVSWAALVEVWSRPGQAWDLWVLFERPPNGTELAALLCGDTGGGGAGWGSLATRSVANEVASALPRQATACLADLWAAS